VERDVARTFRQVLGVECVAQAVCPHQVPDSSECGLHVIANVNAIINDHTSWFGRRVASLREMRRTDHLWDAATATTRGTPIHGGETLRMTNDEIKSTLTKCAPGTTIGTTWRYLGDSDSREWLGRVYEPIGRNEKRKWPLEFRIVDEDGDIASVQSQWPRPPNYNGRPVEILTIRRYGQELSANEVRRHHTGTVSRAQPGDTKARTIKGSTPRGDTRPEHQPTAATGQPATTEPRGDTRPEHRSTTATGQPATNGPRGDSRPREVAPTASAPNNTTDPQKGDSSPRDPERNPKSPLHGTICRETSSNPNELALPDLPFDKESLIRLVSGRKKGDRIRMWRHVHGTTIAEQLEGRIVDGHTGHVTINTPTNMSLKLFDDHTEHNILCIEFPNTGKMQKGSSRKELVVVEIDAKTTNNRDAVDVWTRCRGC